MNYLLISVLVLGVGCMVLGYMKGFIRIVISLIATMLTLVLVGMFTPVVTNAVIEYSPLDEAISTKYENMFFGDSIYTEGVNTEEEEYTLSQQIIMIQAVDLPDFLKEAMIENNNSEIYEQLGVDTFAEYISAYLTEWTIKVVAFIITFLIVWVIMRLVFFSLVVLSNLPLLHGINRAIGTVLGLGFAVIIVWIGYLALALLHSSSFAQQCYIWIEESQLLTFLYDTNPIWKLLM